MEGHFSHFRSLFDCLWGCKDIFADQHSYQEAKGSPEDTCYLFDHLTSFGMFITGKSAVLFVNSSLVTLMHIYRLKMVGLGAYLASYFSKGLAHEY